MPLNPRLARAKSILERRVFLKALGLGMAAPVAFKLARTATAQSVGAPKRFFLMFMPHGIPPEHYNPRAGSSPTDFRLNDTNVSILGPLEQYKQYVNVYEGFQYPGKADTHNGIVNCLTGYSGADTTSARTSIETVIAKGLGTKATILGACSHLPYGLDNNGMLFWDGKVIDPEKNPAKVADALFGNLGGGGAPAPAPANAEVEIRNELLKLNMAEIEALKGELTGLTSEQTKLSSHLTAVESLLSNGNGPGPGQQLSCTTKPTLPTVEKVRAASAGQVIDSSGGNDYFYQEKNFPLLFEAQLELVAQALICNASQVMALMPMYATCDFDFGFAEAPGSHHNTLSHTTASGKGQWDSPVSVDNYDPMTRQGFAKAQLWFTKMLVNKVVKVLAETDDPAGDPGSKVLDNTLIYWMSEIGDGANHTRTSYLEYPQVPQSLPLVTIGKCGGAIKSGQYLQAMLGKPEEAENANRPAADLYQTMAQAMGVSASIPGFKKLVSEVLA
jgi:hypothetical protein